jgi:hypothetical protein
MVHGVGLRLIDLELPFVTGSSGVKSSRLPTVPLWGASQPRCFWLKNHQLAAAATRCIEAKTNPLATSRVNAAFSQERSRATCGKSSLSAIVTRRHRHACGRLAHTLEMLKRR